MLKILLKDIFKNKPKDYNDIEELVNIYRISESGNFYGHVKEFARLSKTIKYDAHRVISSKATKLLFQGKMYGSVIDINGNTYIFEIFNDATYRVISAEMLNKSIKEVIDEKYFKGNS